MGVIGFHYTKITAEKNKAAIGNVKVGSDVTITETKEAKVNLGDSKQKGIEFSFTFKTKYDPDIANIFLEGALVYLSTPEKIKDCMAQWQKEKMLPKDVLEEVYNQIIGKCNIDVLIFGKELQLPPHIIMPKVKATE